jgi:hypothetical protein
MCQSRTYLTLNISKGGLTKIVCPGAGCKVHLKYEEIKQLIDYSRPFRTVHLRLTAPNVRYDELLTHQACQSDVYFRYCANGDCRTGQIIENGGISFVANALAEVDR